MGYRGHQHETSPVQLTTVCSVVKLLDQPPTAMWVINTSHYQSTTVCSVVKLLDQPPTAVWVINISLHLNPAHGYL
jgi:hypothetical protein